MFLKEHEELLKKVHDLMKKLSSLKKGEALRQKTELRPIQRNATRWSSSFMMLKDFKILFRLLTTMIQT